MFLAGASLPALAQAQPAADAATQELGYSDADLATGWRLLTLGGLTIKNDWRAARENVRAARAVPGFDNMPPDFRSRVLVVLASIETLENPELGYELVLEAERIAPQLMDAYALRVKAGVARTAGHHEVALETMTQVIFDFPLEVPRLTFAELYRIIDGAKQLPGTERARRDLLERLWEWQYQPPDDYDRADTLWFELLTLYAEFGEDEKVRSLMASISAPEFVAALRFDKRFERFTATAPAGGFPLALKREVDTAYGNVDAKPDELAPLVHLVSELIDQNRLDEALFSVDDTLEIIESGGDGAFVDTADELAWVYDSRARVLMLMGEADQAVEMESKALALSKDGVSQNVNLGGLHNRMGRPEEALKALETIDYGKAGEYGELAANSVRACAYGLLGDEARMGEVIEKMLAHAEDGFGVLRDALLCVGDEERLAGLVIKRLEDPARRVDMLRSLQNYLVPEHRTELDVLKDERWDVVRTRADVREAIDKVGKVLDWPVFSAGT